MDNELERYDYKAEERKRFFKYFRVWMVIAAIAAVAFGGFAIKDKLTPVQEALRNNDKAPAQRVYDYADVLSDAEEQKLSELIASCEEESKCDIVVVTINQEVGASDSEWEHTMVNLADDFYDQKAFGYNQPYGDGALLLDNWYHAGMSDSQAGAWLSTSGKLEWNIGSYEENKVFDAMDSGLDISAYEAYARAVRKIASYGVDQDAKGSKQLPWPAVLIVPVIISLIYAGVNMSQKDGAVTTTSTTYVPGGQPIMNAQHDDFLRKSVSKVKIETSSSSGSRSSGGGSYGHHTSSGGHSHGGGGRRR